MRPGHAATLALTLIVGCARFRYDPLPVADASAIDSSMPDASAPEAAAPDAGSSTPDAASHDADDPDDGAMQASMDAAVDAAASGMGPCAVTITMNTYIGSPRFHGWLTLQNAGATTWNRPTIRFDLPSSARVCNDADILPGPGWTLQSSGGHCTYTKTSPSLSIAPGATLEFEYSSNNPTTQAAPAAADVSVSGCP